MTTSSEIEALVQTTIQAKIVQAFNDAPEAIDKLVQAALNKQVNEHGGKPDSWSRSKMPYLEWLVGEEIRTVARDSVIQVIKSREGDIREAVERAISADTLVDGLIKKLLGALEQDYKVSVQFANED